MIKKILVLSLVFMFGLASVTMLMAAQQIQKKTPTIKPVEKTQVKVLKPMADLTITYCRHLESDITKLKVTVKNIGNKASIPCKLLVEDISDKNNPKKHEVDFPALGPKKFPKPKKTGMQVAEKPQLQLINFKTIIVKCPWPVYNRIIRTTIDSKNVVKEWRENNNRCLHETIPK